MHPFPLQTARLTLNQPTESDVDAVAAYCTDPLAERYLITPWPYERHHAESFIHEFVPHGWATDQEWTWALRPSGVGPLLGVVAIRPASGSIGYWLGAPHRGSGLMTEAVNRVVDEFFDRTDHDPVVWNCFPGNVASMRVAQRVGFRFTGERAGVILQRDGSLGRAWTGELSRHDDRQAKPGWPSEPAVGGS